MNLLGGGQAASIPLITPAPTTAHGLVPLANRLIRVQARPLAWPGGKLGHRSTTTLPATRGRVPGDYFGDAGQAPSRRNVAFSALTDCENHPFLEGPAPGFPFTDVTWTETSPGRGSLTGEVPYPPAESRRRPSSLAMDIASNQVTPVRPGRSPVTALIDRSQSAWLHHPGPLRRLPRSTSGATRTTGARREIELTRIFWRSTPTHGARLEIRPARLPVLLHPTPDLGYHRNPVPSP